MEYLMCGTLFFWYEDAREHEDLRPHERQVGQSRDQPGSLGTQLSILLRFPDTMMKKHKEDKEMLHY